MRPHVIDIGLAALERQDIPRAGGGVILQIDPRDGGLEVDDGHAAPRACCSSRRRAFGSLSR
jgi:hypothetical protein